MTSTTRSTKRAQVGVFLLVCVLLAVAHTWPYAQAPHRHSRVDNADYVLNAWAISWVAHQAFTDPRHLFDGNIFWPARGSLTFSEAMVVQGLMAAPIRAVGGSPILAFNGVMLAGFALTAFAFGLLALRWTGSWTAALVTASAAGFNAHLFTRMAQIQAMHVEFIALALFGLDQMFTRARARDAVTLGVGFALQGLTSIYLLVFTTWAMIFAGGSRLCATPRARRGRVVALAALAAVVALALLAFYLDAYYRTHLDQRFARTVEDNIALAGSYTDYLSSVSWVHYWWSRRFVDVSRSINFPGVTVLILTAVALVPGARGPGARQMMCAVGALGCAAVAVLPRAPGYERIHDLVPLFWAVRVQAHIGQVVLLFLALLAGFGAARLELAWGARRRWLAAAGVLVVLVNAEACRAPLPYTAFTGISPVYDSLRAAPQAVVVEMPLYDKSAWARNAAYMLNSTRHWKPLVNGYSGFMPASYVRLQGALAGFPGQDALDTMHRRGITHVVLHEAAFVGMHGRSAFEEIGTIQSLQEIARDGDIHVYRLR
jgi:hypothetical protein